MGGFRSHQSIQHIHSHMPHNVKHSMLQKQCIKSIVDIQDGCPWVAAEATSPYSTYIVNAYDSEITSEASHVRSKIPQFPTTHIVTLTHVHGLKTISS